MDEIEALFNLYGMYLWGGLCILVLVCVVWLSSLQSRINRTSQLFHQLASGVDGANLEESLEQHLAFLHELMDRHEELAQMQEALERMLRHAIQRVAVVRFNPFGDTGGDQSFSIVLLDADNNGVVLSSLFSRAETRVFAKPIQSGQSAYRLTKEEQEALQQAMTSAPLTPSV